MQKIRIAGLFLAFFVVVGANAQTKKDKGKELDELKMADPSKFTGLWERQGTLEIDGNTDVETIQFNEDGSISYRLNGQIGLFPTPYTYAINYGKVEIKAVFDFYFIDNNLIVIFADRRVKNFTRRRTQGQPLRPGQPNVQMQQQRPLSNQPQQTQPMQSVQPQQTQPMQTYPGGSQQQLNPYLR
ncbi:MAG: hypothetical protein LBG74_00855 [Spirochaetaceae bacterium]|jgi:hypothetical protein|nr:hypothetical protein [Spirochaetaceae bacterium]